MLLDSLCWSGGGTTGPLVDDVAIERLYSISEQLAEKDISPVSLADRKEMMSATEDLIEKNENVGDTFIR